MVDAGRTSMYHGCGTGSHSPPPPIPARLHPTHFLPPRPATALGHAAVGDPDAGYLVPARRGVAVGGPPLPPRQPLRRSVSLTQRPVPQPRTAHVDDEMVADQRGAVREPTLDEVLPLLRRPRVDNVLHTAPLSPALSAPLLGQVGQTRILGQL